MKAWITCDHNGRKLFLGWPDLLTWADGLMWSHPRGGILLHDDQLFLFRPQPGECIELNIEQVPAGSAPSHRGKDVEVYP